MKQVEHRLDIDAPLAALWGLAINVERWPSMFPTVTTVKRLDPGPLRIGSQTLLKQPGQPERIWIVTLLEPDTVFCWTTRAKGFTMTGIHRFTPITDKRTTSRLGIQLDGPLALPIGMLVARKAARTLAIENDGLRASAVK
jgi:uncharacterized membrane protein